MPTTNLFKVKEMRIWGYSLINLIMMMIIFVYSFSALFFTFSYTCMVQKVLESNFRKGDFDGLHVLRSPESENNIFTVCMCVCSKDNSKTNFSRKSKFDILHLYLSSMLLETFYENRTNCLYAGSHKIIRKNYGLWTEFLAKEY